MFSIAFTLSWSLLSYLTCWLCHRKLNVRSGDFLLVLSGVVSGALMGCALIGFFSAAPPVTVPALLSALLIAVLIPFAAGCGLYMSLNPWP